MKNIILPLFIMAASLMPEQVYSQQFEVKSDFIVTMKNDTVNGEVKKSLLRKSDKVAFTPNGETKEIVYKPDNIIAFYSQSEGLFISSTVDLDVSPTDINSLSDNPNPEIKRDTVF